MEGKDFGRWSPGGHPLISRFSRLYASWPVNPTSRWGTLILVILRFDAGPCAIFPDIFLFQAPPDCTSWSDYTFRWLLWEAIFNQNASSPFSLRYIFYPSWQLAIFQEGLPIYSRAIESWRYDYTQFCCCYFKLPEFLPKVVFPNSRYINTDTVFCKVLFRSQTKS